MHHAHPAQSTISELDAYLGAQGSERDCSQVVQKFDTVNDQSAAACKESSTTVHAWHYAIGGLTPGLGVLTNSGNSAAGFGHRRQLLLQSD